ncbi:MAG: choice-of-anchor tandem repeat GloVer-containing protein [Terriglobales bacterium]
MHSAGTMNQATNQTTEDLNFTASKFGSANSAQFSSSVRSFCPLAATSTIREILTLALLSTLLILALAARPALAQETVLYNFTNTPDGATPNSRLTSDAAGNLYGTTEYGGLGYGTVFELSPDEGGGYTETVLYTFTGAPDGANPTYSNVIFDSLGNLYGTTWNGGANGYGTVFELSPVGASWTESILWNYQNSPDGANPLNDLIMDAAGNLYTMTYEGGGTAGTVFELSPNGNGGWNGQVIYGVDTDYSGIAIDALGNLYFSAGNSLYKLVPNGNGGWSATVIHSFAGGTKDGVNPEGTVVIDSQGDVYGTTPSGGTKNMGVVYKLSPVLTGKKKGTYTQKLLYSFKGGKDGATPYAGITFDSAGNIYGTTTAGGKSSDGTVFELVAPVGTGAYKEKILASFDGTDGSQPYNSLILDSLDNVYGTTVSGGTSNVGVVFEVAP